MIPFSTVLIINLFFHIIILSISILFVNIIHYFHDDLGTFYFVLSVFALIINTAMPIIAAFT